MHRRYGSKARPRKRRTAGDADSTDKFPKESVTAAARELLRITVQPPPLAPEGIVAPDDADDSELAKDTPQTIVFPALLSASRATLTMIAGPDAGATFALEGDEVTLGRAPESTVRLEEPSVSRCHARITSAGGGSHVIEDLGSTNGTFVGGRRVRRAALASGDRLQLGRECVFRFALIDETEESLQRRLYESSMRDVLTNLANRRCLLERLAGELEHARREQRAISVLVFDVDGFKAINDTFGHVAGDQVLRAIAMRGAQVLRAADVFARHGGDEFAVIARDADKAEALALAERLRGAIAELRVEVGSGAVSFSVSIGVAASSEAPGNVDPKAILERADARLYAAKRAGRDRVDAGG